MGLDRGFWNGKTVLITGHRGFKGSWLTLLLHELNSKVVGLNLNSTESTSLIPPSTYASLGIKEFDIDVTNLNDVERVIALIAPDIVIHLAAQPLVLKGYQSPFRTFEVNVMGALSVQLSAYKADSVKTVIIATTDKVYKTTDVPKSFNENSALGGTDPYSGSKASAELAIYSIAKSFQSTSTQTYTVRAGNVVGGGDIAKNRLLPDIYRAHSGDGNLTVRNLNSTRPYQYIIDCLVGYLKIAEMSSETKNAFDSFNIGPNYSISTESVINISKRILQNLSIDMNLATSPPWENPTLQLDSSKSKRLLNWEPRYSPEESVEKALNWYKNFSLGEDAVALTKKEILDYL